MPKKSSNKEKKDEFEVNQKSFLLTYPKCDMDKEVLLEQLTEIQEPSLYYIAREKHEDGSLHLHATVRFTKRVHSKDPRVFDVGGYHPNIKKLLTNRAFDNAIQYVKKDGDFITNVTEKLGKRQRLFLEVLDKGITPSLIREHPEIMQFNLGNLKAWFNMLHQNAMVLKDLPKKRHIWVHGPRDTGKTTFARIFQNMFLAPALLPYNDDFGFVPYNCDFLFGDEFKGQLGVQQLNRICDGGCHVNTKGGSLILGQPTVFICSNFSIDECYSQCEPHLRDTVHARFQQFIAPIFPSFPKCEL